MARGQGRLGRRLGRRLGWEVIAWLALALPQHASAVPETRSFVINPAESSVSLDAGSRVLLELGLPSGPVELPIEPQGGRDTTALRGVVLTEIDLNPGFPRIRFQSPGTIVAPANGDAALPGLPDDPTTPAPAQLAGAFQEPLLGISGTTAIRNSAFDLGGNYSMEQLEAGRFGFPLVNPGFPPPVLAARPGRGVADIAVSALRFNQRGQLVANVSTPFPGGGLVEELGGDRLRLTVPIDFDLSLLPPFGGPVRIEVGLSGQIVAYSPVLPVPEPGPTAGIAACLLALAWLRRARSGGL